MVGNYNVNLQFSPEFPRAFLHLHRLDCAIFTAGASAIDINWTETIITAVVVLLGAAVHGTTGFGFSAISMGFLPLFRSVAPASIIVSILAILTNLRVFWSVKSRLNLFDWRWAVGGLLLGTFPGVLIFRKLDETGLRIAIGIVLIILVIIIGVIEKTGALIPGKPGVQVRHGWSGLLLTGFLGGLLCGAVSIPGPPILVYGAFMLTAGVWKRDEMKALFTAFFGSAQFVRLVMLRFTGYVTWGMIVESLILIPALIFGAWIGIKMYGKISSKSFTWVVIAVMGLIGLILIVSSVLRG